MEAYQEDSRGRALFRAFLRPADGETENFRRWETSSAAYVLPVPAVCWVTGGVPCSVPPWTPGTLLMLWYDSPPRGLGLGQCKAGSSLFLFPRASASMDDVVVRVRTSVWRGSSRFVYLGIGWEMDGYKLTVPRRIPVLFPLYMYRRVLASQPKLTTPIAPSLSPSPLSSTPPP